jgi:hypothetical protein
MNGAWRPRNHHGVRHDHGSVRIFSGVHLHLCRGFVADLNYCHGMRATKTIAVVGFSILALGATGGARSARITGAVAAITPGSFEIVTKSEGTKVVSLSSTTEYLRWITHKPWQGNQQADFSSLAVGRCVEADLRSADANEAKRVFVSLEPIGSIYDPCRTFRK